MDRNPMRTAIAVKLAEMDMTQNGLAKRVGVAESTISRWVNFPDTMTISQFRDNVYSAEQIASIINGRSSGFGRYHIESIELMQEGL